MKATIQKGFALFTVVFCFMLVTLLFHHPVESARRYQYRVLSVTGMKELRTQSDVDQGRLKTIESLIEQQSAQGWEFYQADGYVLYFRR
jgi:hypothetical protein